MSSREKWVKNRLDAVEKHVKSIEWIRDELSCMDEMINPVLGIVDWDDAACVEFGSKRLVASVDGPYTKRMVLKSALIHASTDVVVKGARPLFALDALVGPESDLRGMVDSLKKQALEMRIPILGGNTLFEDVEPMASIVVVGELVVKEPIRDCGMKVGDVVALLGEPLWGELDDRLVKARKLFDCWFSLIGSGAKFNAAKDVTKGGLAGVVYEMQEKSGRKIDLNENLSYPFTRNLDNFIVSVPEDEYEKTAILCSQKKCALKDIGRVR